MCSSLRHPAASPMQWGPVTRASPRAERRGQGRGPAWLSELQCGHSGCPLGTPIRDLGGGDRLLLFTVQPLCTPGLSVTLRWAHGQLRGPRRPAGQVTCVTAQHLALSLVCLLRATALSLLGSSRGWGENRRGLGAGMERPQRRAPGAAPRH